MNISTTKAFANVLLALGVTVIALVAVISMPIHAAHAQDFGDIGSLDGGFDSGFDTGYTGGDWSSSGFGDTGSCGFSCDSGYTGGDWSSSGFGDTASCGYACDSGYTSSDFSSSDFSSVPGFSSMPSFGGSSFGSGFPFSFGNTRAPAGNSNSNTNVNTNTNTCTTNSCNTTISTPINAPTTIVTQPAPAPQPQPVYYPQPVQPVYQQYQPYQPVYTPPVAYNNRPAPYVSLSAVPYTGLDLGPWGTAAYWGFLILWCLGAAYLIVVKRVQNKLVSALNGLLFGSTPHTTTHAKVVMPVAKQETKEAAPKLGGIDPFIASQINRAAF